MEDLLKKLMYESPSDPTISRITITADVVKGEGEPLIERDEFHVAKKPGTKTSKKKPRRNPA